MPRWLHRSGRGWMTAEYSLLPASTGERVAREAAKGKQGGRTVEIQRLIGRALRSVCDFNALGERTLWLDCDVLQADGGTRCAAISGAYVAAHRALDRFGLSKALTGQIAAVSVGVVEGEPVLDLDYSEDSAAETDMNVVMTADGRLVEVQATAEREPFTRDELDGLLDLAGGGIEEIMVAQDDAVAVSVPDLSTGEALLRLLLAAGLGGAIGLEREMRDHEAGFRTHLLVSLGSCAFTLVSSYGWSDWTFSKAQGVVFDPTRVAAQIVTGIGFLGAGAIIVRGINVRGLDDGGDALGRGGDRDGSRHRLLRGRDRRRGARARLARPAQARQRTLHLAGAARGGGARDRAQARRHGAQVLARIEELGGQVNAVEFGDDRTMDVVLRASRRSESARVAELLAKLEGVERVQWRP